MRDRRDASEKARRAAEEAKKKPPQQSNGNARSGGPGKPSPLARLSVEDLERRIESLNARIKAIDERMSEPGVWSDPRRCHQLGDDRAKLAAELEPLEFEWMARGDG